MRNYGSAYRLFDALMFPVFAEFSARSASDLRQAVEKSANVLLLCGTPATTGLIVIAPNIISALYPHADFTEAAPALQALAPGLLLLYLNMLMSAVLVSTGQERKMTGMAVIALLANLVLNLLLIPRYQHVGAALATTLTELLLLCMSLILLPSYLRPLGSLGTARKVLTVSLAMGALVWLLRDRSLFITIPAAILIYGSGLVLVAAVPRRDVLALYRALVPGRLLQSRAEW